LNATSVTANSFMANWSSVSGATGYQLDVASDSLFTNYVSGYVNRDVGNVTNWNVTGLAANTFYYYRVRAYNGNGASPSSNVARVKTRRH
jgi:phosphodiesterase/alkaline phosphatase D-like protein